MTSIVITKILPSGHKGDLAIALAMLEKIKGMRPKWKLVVCCRDPIRDSDLFNDYGDVEAELFAKSDAHSSVVSVGLKLFRYFLCSFLPKFPLDIPGQQFVTACRSSEALVFCGGGSPGGYGFINLVLHALMPIVLAKRFSTPIIYAAIGLEPISNPFHRALMRWVLNKSDLIMARDPIAVENLQALGVTTRLELTADWAIELAVPSFSEIQQLLKYNGIRCGVGPRVGLNLRDERALGPEGRDSSGSKYRILMKSMVKSLLEKTSAELIVVSMTRTTITDDLLFAQSIKKELPETLRARFHVLADDYSPQTIKGVIGSMDIFIGTRLHPTIFAVSQAIPTLVVHNFHKAKGFMKYCHLNQWFMSLDDASESDIVEAGIRLLESRQQVSSQIKARIPLLREAVSRNVLLIEQSLNKSISENC